MKRQKAPLFKWKIRKGDTVQVLAGKDRGKQGKVLKVDRHAMRLWVEKVNLVKKHVKASQENPGGGFLMKEASLHYSNVLLFCPKCQKGVRVGWKKEEQDKKRVCRKCGHLF